MDTRYNERRPRRPKSRVIRREYILLRGHQRKNNRESGCLWQVWNNIIQSTCHIDTVQHYQRNLLRLWPQKLAVFLAQCWQLDPHPLHSHLQIRAHSSSSLSFFINHQNILPITPMYCSWKAINLSVWIKEICIQLVKLHIICSRMQSPGLLLNALPS